MSKLISSAIQMATSPNVNANLLKAGQLIEDAVDHGAALIVLPENFSIMGMHETDKLQVAEQAGAGPIQDFLAYQAQKHKIWLVGGTIPLISVDNKVTASCLIHNAEGALVGRYDKIHLFDVNVPGTDETYFESNTICAGHRPLIVDTPWGRLGIAICYDLRFPEQFRYMANQGMDILAIPAAFTQKTGAAHWEVLLRARAIENQCFVIAANQGGFHLNGRETFGHSMLIDPWGQVLSCLPSGAGSASAELDLNRIAQIRASFPVLTHCRMSKLTAIKE